MEETKEVEILTISGKDLVVIDEDEEVVYTTNIDDPKDVVILKKENDDVYELDEVERMPYLKTFINKYGNLLEEQW